MQNMVVLLVYLKLTRANIIMLLFIKYSTFRFNYVECAIHAYRKTIIFYLFYFYLGGKYNEKNRSWTLYKRVFILFLFFLINVAAQPILILIILYSIYLIFLIKS